MKRSLVCNRKRVNVESVKEAENKQGYIYTLYVDESNNYYSEFGEGTDELIRLGNFENREEAEEAFNEHLNEMSEGEE